LSNLDRRLRTQMRRELLALQRRVGITTIFVTHDQEEAMTTADRMAVLDQGVVQQIGTPVALYDYPANAFVASFVGTMNLLPARVSRRQARSMTLQLEGIGDLEWAADANTPAAERLMLSFRPHSLCVDAADAARDASCLWLAGIVEGSEFLGEAMRYRVRVGSHSVCVDQPHRAGLSTHEVGASIGLGLDRTQVRLLPH
jgi:iron(III) transport system ATP-binding protein